MDAVLEERDDGTREVLAPRGWVFPKNPAGTGDVFIGTCAAHWVK